MIETPSLRDSKMIAIHQPNTFPRLKVLQKIISSDIWVVYDDVQYVRREWQNRARLRHYHDPKSEFWITIPVKRNEVSARILDIQMLIPDFDKAFGALHKTVRHTYARSKHWKWIEKYMSAIANCCGLGMSLRDFNLATTKTIYDMLGLPVQVVFSSDLNVVGNRNEKLINICAKLNATTYISGSGGKRYLDRDAFHHQNIKVKWQEWDDLHYYHQYGKLNWRDVSFLDFVARYGPDEIVKILAAKF